MKKLLFAVTLFTVSFAGCEKESTLNDQNDSKAQISQQGLTRGDKLRYNHVISNCLVSCNPDVAPYVNYFITPLSNNNMKEYSKM